MRCFLAGDIVFDILLSDHAHITRDNSSFRINDICSWQCWNPAQRRHTDWLSVKHGVGNGFITNKRFQDFLIYFLKTDADDDNIILFVAFMQTDQFRHLLHAG